MCTRIKPNWTESYSSQGEECTSIGPSPTVHKVKSVPVLDRVLKITSFKCVSEMDRVLQFTGVSKLEQFTTITNNVVRIGLSPKVHKLKFVPEQLDRVLKVTS